MKWEPIAAMIAVLALGAWIALGPAWRSGMPKTRPGSHAVELRIGNDRGALEYVTEDGATTYRFLFRDGSASQPFSQEQLEVMLPKNVATRVLAGEHRWLFRLLNITSTSALVWVAIGFGAQLAFSARFLIQWFVSEKKKSSTVPEIFWWISLLGGVGLFAYFAWRQDPVGVLGQSSGLVIYARNIRLIHKQKRRAARDAETPAPTPAPDAPPPAPDDPRPFPTEPAEKSP